MDQNRFQEAQAAYDAGDYRTAAKVFLASAGRGAEGNGAAYHMAGNALCRLRRYQDAVTVYGHALRDPLYERRGAVQANLGAAYVAIGEYAQAANAYESALAEPDYAARYKALQGLAGALLERGRVEDAAVNYRKAALDASNPDPGRALVNLGLCFMALGRPGDAVEAYKAALGFEDYKGRGKALSNMGQAFVVLGEYEEAVKAFEKATQLHGFKLSAGAAAAYASAKQMAEPDTETVEGWETGEIGMTDLAAAFDAPAAESAPPATKPAVDAVEFGDDAAVSDFFNMTEDQMLEQDREARREARGAGRRSGGGIKGFVILGVVAILIGGALGGAYTMGFGWPTQQAMVSKMLTAYGTGAPTGAYWIAAESSDVAREMAKVPPVQSFTIDSKQSTAQSSIVRVTVTPKTGAPLHYRVSLAREGLGWKITGIENDFGSTSGN
ncbi:MAG: tetratricopeptide repeat protein [Coriobacteriia bacterium]|nr:tetratricopeptide repeat protein [Coriobacteriia bacterium]